MLVLATAAHHSIACNVARHLGLFDKVLATQLPEPAPETIVESESRAPLQD